MPSCRIVAASMITIMRSIGRLLNLGTFSKLFRKTFDFKKEKKSSIFYKTLNMNRLRC